MVYKFLGKTFSCGTVTGEIMPNHHPLDLDTWQLAEESHNPITVKSEKRKV